jgi:hypothetical protein
MNGKTVMIQLRGGKPLTATLQSSEPNGVWIASASDLIATSSVLQNIQNPVFFVPWTNVDWIATKD